jgi:hypothetical protein
VALINTLNQLAKSIHFASTAMELEFGEKIVEMKSRVVDFIKMPALILGTLAIVYLLRRRRSEKILAKSQ